MVLGTGLEPARVAPHAPQACVSTIPPPEHLNGDQIIII